MIRCWIALDALEASQTAALRARRTTPTPVHIGPAPATTTPASTVRRRASLPMYDFPGFAPRTPHSGTPSPKTSAKPAWTASPTC